MRKWIIYLLFGWVSLGNFPSFSQAAEIALESGLVHLPASSYHYLGYNLRLGFGSEQSHFVWSLGTNHPYSAAGYTQNILFTQIGWEWLTSGSWIKPFFGLGIGAYADRVSDQVGVIPSLVIQGGIKMGGPKIGIQLSASNYLGIYQPSQLASWIIWPLVNFMGGIYLRF